MKWICKMSALTILVKRVQLQFSTSVNIILKVDNKDREAECEIYWNKINSKKVARMSLLLTLNFIQL